MKKNVSKRPVRLGDLKAEPRQLRLEELAMVAGGGVSFCGGSSCNDAHALLQRFSVPGYSQIHGSL